MPSSLPSAGMARMFVMLCDTDDANTRKDEDADLYTVAEALTSLVRSLLCRRGCDHRLGVRGFFVRLSAVPRGLALASERGLLCKLRHGPSTV